MKTAILGAGVSGLALARALIEGGLDANDITLFEAAPVAGGLCRSKVIDGFTYDLAGGHILFSKKKEILDWMQTAGGGPEAFEERQRNTAIRFEDRWVRYPFENGIGDLPEQANYECLAGYVHAWHQRKLTGSEAPADFGAWIQWRFGEGIAKHFMDPYNEKIWKRPLQEITSEWVAGRVPDAPIEDVLRAAVGIRTEGYVHQSVFWYPKQGGFQAITDGMAADLQDRIRLSTPVDKITRQGEGWAVHGEEFDRVVLTTPLDLTPRLVEGVPQDVAKAMGELEYNGLVTYLVALDTPEQPDLSWCYLPHPNQGPANGLLGCQTTPKEALPRVRVRFWWKSPGQVERHNRMRIWKKKPCLAWKMRGSFSATRCSSPTAVMWTGPMWCTSMGTKSAVRRPLGGLRTKGSFPWADSDDSSTTTRTSAWRKQGALR